MAASTRPPW